MNILFVTTEFVSERNFDGGLSNYLYKICKLLQKHGHTPLIVTISHENSVINYHGIDVYRVKSTRILFLRHLRLFTLDKIIKNLVNSYRLNKIVNKIQCSREIDAVQYSSYELVAFFAKNSQKNIIRCSSYDPELRAAYLLKEDVFSALHDYLNFLTLKSVKTIYAPSFYVAEKISSKIKASVPVIRTPLVYSVKEEPSVYLEKLEGKKYFLFFGTIGTLKGVDLIAELLTDLLTKYQDMYFVFAGDIVENRQFKFDDLFACPETLRNKIIYLGRLSKEQLKSVVSYAHLVILPSRVDNLPNTLLESVYFNKLVVGPDGASFDEVLHHGDTGFLFAEYKKESLLTAIFEAMDFLEAEVEPSTRRNKNLEYLREFEPEVALLSLIKFIKSNCVAS